MKHGYAGRFELKSPRTPCKVENQRIEILKQHIGCVCSAALAVMLACGVESGSDPGDEFRAGGPPGDFEASYVGCDEFAGVSLVPLANVAELVPDDYTIIEPSTGFAIVVAQAGSCDEISVNGQHAQPGIFAQFGV